MSIKSNDDYDQYREKAKQMFQVFFRLHGHTRFHEYNPDFRMAAKIAFAIFVDPEFQSLLRAYRQCYSRKQRKKAIEIRDTIFQIVRSNSPEEQTISMSFITVIGQSKETNELVYYPVFRVLKQRCELVDIAWYVDQEGRVYDTWTKYLNENRLPRGHICYPANGYYSSSLTEHVTYTPNAKIQCRSSKLTENGFIRFFDKGIPLMVLCGAAGSIALFAGVTLPPVGMTFLFYGTSACTLLPAAYTSGRSAYTLVDRYNHYQTINPLKDSEAAQSWLTIANSIVSVAAGGINAYVATALEAEKDVGTILQAGVWAANGARVGVGAAGFTNQAFIMYEKGFKNWSRYDYLQMTLSTFFLVDSIISFQTPASIGRGVVVRKENSLKMKATREFYQKHTKGLSSKDLKASVRRIKILNDMENIEDFYNKFKDVLCKAANNGTKFDIQCSQDGVIINGVEFKNVKNIQNIDYARVSGIEFKNKLEKTVEFLKVMAFNCFKDRFLGRASLNEHIADAQVFTQPLDNQTLNRVLNLGVGGSYVGLHACESYMQPNLDLISSINDNQWENLYLGLQFLSLQNIQHVPNILHRTLDIARQVANQPMEVVNRVSFAIAEYIEENAAAIQAQNNTLTEAESQELVINSQRCEKRRHTSNVYN